MRTFKPHLILLAPAIVRALIALVAAKWLTGRDGLAVLWTIAEALSPLIGDQGRAVLEAAPSVVWGGFFLVAGSPLLAAIIEREAMRLEVADGEIVWERGVFARTTMDIATQEIVGVDVLEPVLGRIFDFGTLVVETRGRDRLVIAQLAHARECAGLILDAKRHGWGQV